MPKIERKQDGTLKLPREWVERDGLPAEWWIEQRNGAIVLLPRAADIRKLYVEPTTRCNLNCITCVRNVWSDTPAHMSEPIFDLLMEQARELPRLRQIYFGGTGEPLSHPHILDMIALAREQDYSVSISTNALLLDAATAKELIELGINRLVVSLDGVDSGIYASVRGTGISRAQDNIQRFNSLKRELGVVTPTLEIEFVALERNKHELPRLSQMAARLEATHVLVSHVLAHSKEMWNEALYGLVPAPRLPAANWPVKTGAWVTWGTMDLPRTHWGAEPLCRFIHDSAAVIGWDGAVVPCYALAHDYPYYAVDGQLKQVSRYVLGRINHRSLAEIWMSEQYCRFRLAVRQFEFPSCPDCELGETCDLRQANQGCWGWNPSCSDCLYAQDIVRCPGGGR